MDSRPLGFVELGKSWEEKLQKRSIFNHPVFGTAICHWFVLHAQFLSYPTNEHSKLNIIPFKLS
jgi:hypothetical protein